MAKLGRKSISSRVPALSRRGFLAASLFPLPASGRDPLRSSVETAREELTRRFLDPWGTLYHYVGLKGEVIRPTAEHCRANQPSIMSWSTPIEDGPFYGGLYLMGLTARARRLRTPSAATDAARMAHGLVRLARASAEDAFIVRGLCADGKSHYAASSEDQFYPWFLGLWTYLRSPLPSASDRAGIRSELLRAGTAIEKHGWRVPCSPRSFGYRGTYLRATAFDSARLLSLLLMLHDLTGDRHWRAEYERRLEECPAPDSFTRLELCAQGIQYVETGETNLWTRSMGVAALRMLMDAGSDPSHRKRFQQGLLASARAAAPHVARYRGFDAGKNLAFDPDWRFLNASWKPHTNADDGNLLARSLLPLWAARNPLSVYEDQCMREPLFAAWIVTLAADPTLLAAHADTIRPALLHFRWSRLYNSSFFVCVNTYYEGIRWGLADPAGA
ncbi:MAG: hypothetical protein JNL98_09435 [Bryobacterales bacterium]|nr:hypothetical protein [Bryobacterales bacterium]